MLVKQAHPQIPLPRNWRSHVKSAVLHTISLAHFSLVHARGMAAGHIRRPVRLAAQNEHLREECALLREEIRIKDARMDHITPQRRPRYGPCKRMAILELRAARSWSLKQTADTFRVAAATIASWSARLEEGGSGALLQLSGPVNRYPDFVRYLVQRLKALCPTMGKVRIADTLCRAGLHLGATTVGRILKEERIPDPGDDEGPPGHVVTARGPNHVWHVDLTVVPTFSGFWTSWSPYSLPQQWPFCWWVGVVLDHCSRSVLGIGVFKETPSSAAMQSLLNRTIKKESARPKYLICDKGKQFWCESFKGWCEQKGIRPRFGAVGKKGSIAVIERFIGSLKSECMDVILVPIRERDFRRELALFSDWYNRHRPHSALRGHTPAEIHNGMKPAGQRSRFEPRARWPAGASLKAPASGERSAIVCLEVNHHSGRQHLPIVALKQAA
ncbi:transposase [Nitrospinota bacterium]